MPYPAGISDKKSSTMKLCNPILGYIWIQKFPCWNQTFSIHFFFWGGVEKKLLSRELTYPPKNGIFESMIFRTSRLVGYVSIPWRVPASPFRRWTSGWCSTEVPVLRSIWRKWKIYIKIWKQRLGNWECKQQQNNPGGGKVSHIFGSFTAKIRKVGEDDSRFDYMKIFQSGLVQPPSRTKFPKQRQHKHQCWIKNPNHVLQVFTSSVNHFMNLFFLGGGVGWVEGVNEKSAVIPGWWVSIGPWKLVDPYPQSGTTKINLYRGLVVLVSYLFLSKYMSQLSSKGRLRREVVLCIFTWCNFLFWVPGIHKKTSNIEKPIGWSQNHQVASMSKTCMYMLQTYKIHLLLRKSISYT